VTVLRDGHLISVNNVTDVTTHSLVADMVGREIDTLYPDKAESIDYTDENLLLEVSDITDHENRRFADINFKLYKGEILGLSGLVGAGRSEVALGIVGLRPLKSGTVKFLGKDISNRSSRQIFDAGLVYLSEDRKESGLFIDLTVKHNIPSMFISTVSKNGLLKHGKEERLAKEKVESLNIRCQSIDQLVLSLSGGNQQKVLVGKILAKPPKVVIMDEPTRGIDVGAKAEIHRLLRELVNQGIGVIIISSELNEIVGMCDRVLVMHEGRINGEVTGSGIEGKNIMHYAAGASE
jgi:ribose transport system ATP-binding protein